MPIAGCKNNSHNKIYVIINQCVTMEHENLKNTELEYSIPPISTRIYKLDQLIIQCVMEAFLTKQINYRSPAT